MQIVPATNEHREAWLRMRYILHEGERKEAIAAEVDEMLQGTHASCCFVALEEDTPIGYIEVALRDWAAGCETKGVGYLEGIYVEDPRRRSGVASALLTIAENWARERGATEFASDVDVENEISQRWHGRKEFREVGRAVLYKKDL